MNNWKMKFKFLFSFIVNPKIMKNLSMNLTPSLENYKKLLKVIMEDLSKWRNTQCS